MDETFQEKMSFFSLKLGQIGRLGLSKKVQNILKMLNARGYPISILWKALSKIKYKDHLTHFFNRPRKRNCLQHSSQSSTTATLKQHGHPSANQLRVVVQDDGQGSPKTFVHKRSITIAQKVTKKTKNARTSVDQTSVIPLSRHTVLVFTIGYRSQTCLLC